jgi:hypothetical protein
MYAGFNAIRNGRSYVYNQPMLLNLFLKSHALKSTNPRDRVYGLIGLAQDCQENSIEVDYNLNCLETYTLVIKHFIRRYNSLNFLCCHGKRDDTLPTWLPSHEKGSVLFHYQLCVSNASKYRVNPNMIGFNERALSVWGIKCDKISVRSNYGLWNRPILVWSKQLEIVCSKIRLSDSPEDIWTNEVVLSLLSFWNTDDEYRNLLGRPRPTLGELGRKVLEILEFPMRMKRMDLSINDIATRATLGAYEFQCISEDHLRIARALNFTILNAAFIGTERNILGLSHLGRNTCPGQPGDEVWVLWGCRMPMVLRPEQSGPPNHYSVIGPAVIPGLMNEEAWKGFRNSRLAVPQYRDLEIERIVLI